MPLVVVALVGQGSAHAQEALKTAVLGDRAYETRQIAALNGYPELGIRAGPVSFGVGVSLAAEYNDNIQYTSTDQKEDLIISPGLTLGVTWPISRTSRLSAGVGLAYRKYLEFNENDYLQLTPESQVALDIPIEDVVITLYDTVSYSQDVFDVGELTGVARYPRLENTIGTTVTWIPERWLFQGGYAFYRYWAFDKDYEYLDRGSHQFFGRVGRFLVVQTRAGLEGSVSFSAYDQPVRNDYSSLSVGPYADWFIREGIRLGVRGGYVVYAFDAVESGPQPENVDGGYAALDFQHRLTRSLSYQVVLTRLLQAGIQSAFSQSTDARLGFNYSFVSYAYLTGAFRYSVGDSKSTGIKENYSWYGPELSLVYSIHPRIRPILSYSLRHRESDLAGRDYNNQRVTLSLWYRF